MQNLEQFSLAGLSGLALGNRGLDPLSLGQQCVVLGLAGLDGLDGGSLALNGHGIGVLDSLVSSNLFIEHAELSESGGEFVEKFFDLAGGHVCGSCVR